MTRKEGVWCGREASLSSSREDCEGLGHLGHCASQRSWVLRDRNFILEPRKCQAQRLRWGREGNYKDPNHHRCLLSLAQAPGTPGLSGRQVISPLPHRGVKHSVAGGLWGTRGPSWGSAIYKSSFRITASLLEFNSKCEERNRIRCDPGSPSLSC